MTATAMGGLLSKIFWQIRYIVQKSVTFDKAKEEKAEINKRAERIMDTYGNNILRLAYSYVHNMTDSEDVLEEVLIRFLEKSPKFESDEHEKAWLLRVTANICKNKLSYTKRHETDELDENLSANEKEDLSFVWNAVKKLSETQREVIHLFYYEGFSSKEISDILKRPENTIRSDLKRARDNLKGILKEEYDFE